MTSKGAFIFGLLTTTFCLPALSEDAKPTDIKISVGTQTPELAQTPRPSTGMQKAAVQQKFGAPVKENPAKGTPPISSWEYADFVVYFENDHVIHSVLKPKYHETKETVIEEETEMSEDDLKVK